CFRNRSRWLTLAPWRTRSSATGTAPVRAASIRGVSPSSLALFGSAPASRSIPTSFKLATLAASARGLEPYAFVTSAFAPRPSSVLTNSSSTRYTAQCSGVVPSGCVPFTGAFFAIRSSAAFRSPASIRSASALPDCAKEGIAAAHNMHATADKVLNRLNNIGCQLVVMSPQSLVEVIDKFVGILERSRESLHHTSFQHVFRAVSLAYTIHCPVVDFFHHVAFGL